MSFNSSAAKKTVVEAQQRYYFKNGCSISPVVINTAFGHSGRGMFPYVLFHICYWYLLFLAKKHELSILSKSFTRFGRKGNYIWYNPLTWKFIRRMPNKSLLNAFGLTNKGVRKAAKKIKKSHRKGYRVIPSYFPEFARPGGIKTVIKEALEAIRILYEVIGESFWILELNISCPNSKEKIGENLEDTVALIKAIKALFPDLILIIKTSPDHPLELYPKLIEAGADCFHCFNTFPFNSFYKEEIETGEKIRSPLEKVGGGGVSGPLIFEKQVTQNKEVRKVIDRLDKDFPVIAGGGIRFPWDAMICFDLFKPVAVGICTSAIRSPRTVARIIKAIAPIQF